VVKGIAWVLKRMLSSETARPARSAKILTIAAHASFVPIGVVTVLLSPMLPTLSARWSLDYSQAGALFTAQYLASTVAVSFSGILVAKKGYRFAIAAGLLAIAASLSLLLTGSQLLGIICIAGYGAGLGISVPAANLLVAEVNPGRRSAALSLLNFSWSAGAVACPFVVAAAAKGHHVQLLLRIVAAFSLLVMIGIAFMPPTVTEPAVAENRGLKNRNINWWHGSLIALGALFFLYVGTENGCGGWIASYANSLGTMSTATAVMTPSFFYFALLAGRWLAPLLLRRIDELRVAQGGLLLACVGMAGLTASHNLTGVAVSAGAAGLGLSSVYPIMVSLLSREFGSAATKVGSVTFTMANLGGGCLPWLVGVFSTRFATLKAGLAVPLIGAALALMLFLRNWNSSPSTVS
jgi:FHS family glucose/mannose:H+ symporter-like MFS transporter